MAYIVAPSCHKCKYTDCVSVCPVDCFYELDNMLVIHPEECIDCGACEPECPASAIFEESDLPDKWNYMIEFNAVTSGAMEPADASGDYSGVRGLPADVINEQKEPLPNADAEIDIEKTQAEMEAHYNFKA